MAINVLGLPSNWRAPGTYIANSPASGGGTVGLLPTMMIGQMSASGTAIPNVPVQVFAQSDVNTLFGSKSMLAQMFYYYRENDPLGAIIVCPVSDNVAGTPASVAITISGSASAAGALTIYVNNIAIFTAVNSADTAATVATNMAAAITSAVNNSPVPLGVSASATTSTVTITSLHKGVSVGDLQVSVGKNGEFLPAGITTSVGAIVAGTGDPDLTTCITNITPVPWSFLVCPYSTTTVNGQVNTMLSDLTGRWSPVAQLYGDSFNAVRGTLSAITTYGGTIGANKHMSTLAIMDSQTPVYDAAAIFAGLAADTSRSDAALPIVGALSGLDAPSLMNRLRRVDENTLLFNGISALRVDLSGNSNLSRAVQNFQTNTSYLNIETDFLVAYVDTYIRTDLENTYAQVSLLADGNPVSLGSQATTPSLVLAHVWTLYADLVDLNIAQNLKAFVQGSYVEANIQAGTISLFLPVVTAGQLRIIKILNSFM